MPTPLPSRARRRALALSAYALVGAGLVLAVSWPGARLARDPEAGAAADRGDAATLAPRDAPNPPDRDPGTARTAAPHVAPPPLPTFEACIDELVQLGQRTAALAQQDDTAGATASDRLARDAFAALMERFPDAGERSLALLATLGDSASGPAPVPSPVPSPMPVPVPVPAEPSPSEQDRGRCIVLQLVIRTECERRDVAAAAAGDRSRIDALVQNVLDVMPGNATTAQTGAAVLVHQRFLRACHERSVLGLLRLAGEGRFPRDIATQLLLTLWDNLQRHGERSADEATRLAMLLLGDDDPSQRTAACRQLLRDARYRPLVLAWLRERSDRAVASEVAALAANELAPADACGLLRELEPLLPHAASAWLALGFRAPEAVADGYRELLAANTHTATRADIVTGIGMTQTAIGLELAQQALDHDPAPEVRTRAVMALTARSEPGLGERALERALDDPAFHGEPARLAGLVFALQNLAATGQTNAVDRLGQRLRAMPLLDDSRRTLDAILQRSLPDGRTSRPRGDPDGGGTPR